MRRKMSALTTTIFGAVVTASSVSAQQSPSADQTPRAQSAALESAAASDPDPLFGMTAMRRRAICCVTGWIISTTSNTIAHSSSCAKPRIARRNSAKPRNFRSSKESSAQRGLRDAADAESPYALSDRSQHRNGFMAAKPDIRVASNGDRTKATSPRPSRPDQPPKLGSDNEDQGEPIQLASADLISSDPAGLSRRMDRARSKQETRLPIVDRRKCLRFPLSPLLRC